MNASRFLSVARSLAARGGRSICFTRIRRTPAPRDSIDSPNGPLKVLNNTKFTYQLRRVIIKDDLQNAPTDRPNWHMSCNCYYSKKECYYFLLRNGLAQVPRLPQPMALPYMGMGKIPGSDWCTVAGNGRCTYMSHSNTNKLLWLCWYLVPK